MKINIVQILKAILFLIIFGTIIYVIKYSNEVSFKEDSYKLNFKGKVITKYNDKNDHNIPKIEILLYNGKTFVYDLANDNSGLYEYVIQGDSIEKESNSSKVRVFNYLRDTIFILEF